MNLAGIQSKNYLKRWDGMFSILPAGRLRQPKALNHSSVSVSKTDLVPAYQIGSDQNGPPDMFIDREECHRQKKLNRGHFAMHGTVFQLDGVRKAPDAEDVSTRFGVVRDASVSPGERVIQDYADEEAYALAIIDIGWMRASHAQVVSA